METARQYTAPDTTPLLAIAGLTKAYRRQSVLRGITLDIKPGEFFGLVGVNGAGKTTLLKSLLDFCDIDAGHISIRGIDHRNPHAREALAYLPERFLPPYYLNGRSFLSYMLKMHGLHYDDTAVHQTLEELDLEPAALAKPVRAFSKGMAQKLGLAAVLLSGKPLLVLDEPMSGLDPKAHAMLKRRLLRERERGTTAFFCTHMLADVQALCDRMAILHEGTLRFVGTPDACCTHYGVDDLEQAYLACIA